MVIDPLVSCRQIGGSTRGVKMIVHVEPDLVGLPLGSEYVIVVSESSGGDGVRRANSLPTGISGAVNCAMDDRRFAADVFHDVDFAAGRPADFFNVIAQHPERGPDSLPVRNLDSGFKTSVSL